MIILAIDSSAVTASAALTQDGKLLGEFFINAGLTHSQTLMPMIDDLFSRTHAVLDQVELFAVSSGPGSFTGIRIGIAAVKGLAMPKGTPCAGVSTLEAIARNLSFMEGTVCAVMDARCRQVYNAIFKAGSGKLERRTPDRAVSMEELAKDCEKYAKPLFLVGDGAKLCYNSPWFQNIGAILPPELLLYQRASSVAQAAEIMAAEGKTVSPEALVPFYLRPARVERSLKK